MIVRIAGEGQFKLPDEDAARLNELDNAAVGAHVRSRTGFVESMYCIALPSCSITRP